jgi:hypothetical protein
MPPCLSQLNWLLERVCHAELGGAVIGLGTGARIDLLRVAIVNMVSIAIVSPKRRTLKPNSSKAPVFDTFTWPSVIRSCRCG